ncbi:MAG: hypothetical protein CL844_00065 [Crocinitomicaceae bacterium]|nr:hypothetical protein [Crocinitomicaceae bacterium]
MSLKINKKIMTKIYTLLLFVFISILSFSQTEEIKTYYENGQLNEEFTLVDGWKEGIYKSYYENGQLYSKGKYRDGIKIGLWKIYFDNGKLFKEINWIDELENMGWKEGIYREYDYNGILLVEGNYIDGKRDGIWKYYWKSNGKLKRTTKYKDGDEIRY